MLPSANELARHAALAVLFFLALVVAGLPGTTSAALTPNPAAAAVRLTDGEFPQAAFQAALSQVAPDAPSASSVPLALSVEIAPEPDPAPLPSYFDGAQVVSVYGHPGVGQMGELGLHGPDGAAEFTMQVAAEYDALNGDRDVIGAYHLIVDIAQMQPQWDGSYLLESPTDMVREYVEAARDRDMLLFIDLQIGWGDPLDAVRRMSPFLYEPFVHIALDPEFATRHRGAPPGIAIGALGAEDVNRVQAYLADFVRRHHLPPKILVLHQFTPDMLFDTDRFADVPEVEVTVDMDGFGAPAPKFGGYQRYALADYSERAAIKLFYHWDAPLILPEHLAALERPPDYVIYQ